MGKGPKASDYKPSAAEQASAAVAQATMCAATQKRRVLSAATRKRRICAELHAGRHLTLK